VAMWIFGSKIQIPLLAMYLESGMWNLGWRPKKRGVAPGEWRFCTKNPDSTFAL